MPVTVVSCTHIIIAIPSAVILIVIAIVIALQARSAPIPSG